MRPPGPRLVSRPAMRKRPDEVLALAPDRRARRTADRAGTARRGRLDPTAGQAAACAGRVTDGAGARARTRRRLGAGGRGRAQPAGIHRRTSAVIPVMRLARQGRLTLLSEECLAWSNPEVGCGNIVDRSPALAGGGCGAGGADRRDYRCRGLLANRILFSRWMCCIRSWRSSSSPRYSACQVLQAPGGGVMSSVRRINSSSASPC